MNKQATRPLLDSAVVEQLVSDVGHEMMPTLIESLKDEAPPHIAAIVDACAGKERSAQQVEAIKFHSHALRGMAVTLGLALLSETASWIEHEGRKIGTPSDSDPAAETLASCAAAAAILPSLLERSVAELQSYLATSE